MAPQGPIGMPSEQNGGQYGFGCAFTVAISSENDASAKRVEDSLCMGVTPFFSGLPKDLIVPRPACGIGSFRAPLTFSVPG